MSLLPRTLRACTSASVSSAVSTSRAFSTTTARCGLTSEDVRNQSPKDLEYQFDDYTSDTWRRLKEIDGVRSLIAKVTTDKAALKSASARFVVPKGQIRVTTTVDLSKANSPYHVKSVVVAPVSSLPLKTPEAIQRLKLLAGPRWSPGFPGRRELGPDAAGVHGEAHAADKNGKEGYVKIAEERFPAARMNRKSASDMLERLVEAANDPKSALPADAPVDMRHLFARQSKKKGRNGQTSWARSEAMKRRPEVVGGVRGFPKEWLA